MPSATANCDSIRYHTQNGKTLVYQIENATNYGITLSPVSSRTETLVTETFYAEEHVLNRPETSTIVYPKLCHQLPSNIEDRMRNCLNSSSEVINSYLIDNQELPIDTQLPVYSYQNHDSVGKVQSDYYYADFSDDDKDFSDSKSLSDGVNESFAVIEDFAKVLEETDSIFEEVDCDGFDDQWSISDEKVRRIVGIVKRQKEHEKAWDAPEKISASEVIECLHPTVRYAESNYPDRFIDEILSDRISFGSELQLPSIFNGTSRKSIDLTTTSEQKNNNVPQQPNFSDFSSSVNNREPIVAVSVKSSGNCSPKHETETSENSVLVNMIQDYVKMVMDVSKSLSQSIQSEAPEGHISGFSSVSNVIENGEKTEVANTTQSEIGIEGLGNISENGSSVEECSYEKVEFHPIAPRKSSVEKWESVTLRAERLSDGEQNANESCEEKLEVTRSIELVAEPLDPLVATEPVFIHEDHIASLSSTRDSVEDTSVSKSSSSHELEDVTSFEIKSTNINTTESKRGPGTLSDCDMLKSFDIRSMTHEFDQHSHDFEVDQKGYPMSTSNNTEFDFIETSTPTANDWSVHGSENWEGNVNPTLYQNLLENHHDNKTTPIDVICDDLKIGTDDSCVQEAEGCSDKLGCSTESIDNQEEMAAEEVKNIDFFLVILPNNDDNQKPVSDHQKQENSFETSKVHEDTNRAVPNLPENFEAEELASFQSTIENELTSIGNSDWIHKDSSIEGSFEASIVSFSSTTSVDDQASSKMVIQEALEQMLEIVSKMCDPNPETEFKLKEEQSTPAESLFGSKVDFIPSSRDLLYKSPDADGSPSEHYSTMMVVDKDVAEILEKLLENIIQQNGHEESHHQRSEHLEFVENVNLEQIDDDHFQINVTTANGAINVEQEICDNVIGLEHNQSSNQSNAFNVSENAPRDGNDQNTDEEIADILHDLLAHVLQEMEQVGGTEEQDQIHEHPGQQPDILSISTAIVVREELAIDTSDNQPTSEPGNAENHDVRTVLERCVNVVETMDFLFNEVVNSVDTGCTMSELMGTEDVLDVFEELVSIVERTSIEQRSHSEEEPVDINFENDSITNVMEDLLIAVCSLQRLDGSEGSELGLKPSSTLNNEHGAKKEKQIPNILPEENYQGPSDSINIQTQKSEEYNRILFNNPDIDYNTSDIVNVISSVVCVAEVVTSMIDDVVSFLESVSVSNLEDKESAAIFTCEKKSVTIEEKFEVGNFGDGRAIRPIVDEVGDVEDAMISMVSIVEVVEKLLETSSAMIFENQPLEQISAEPPSKLAEAVSDPVSVSLSSEKSETSAHVEIEEPMGTCTIPSRLNPEVFDEIELRKQLPQHDWNSDLQFSHTNQQMEQSTFILDRILSVVEVVENIVQEVTNAQLLEYLDKIENQQVENSNAAEQDRDSCESEIVKMRGFVLEESDNSEKLKVSSEEVNESEEFDAETVVDENELTVGIDMNTSSLLGNEVCQLIASVSEKIEQPATIKPRLLNCELFPNSVLKESEMEQGLCEPDKDKQSIPHHPLQDFERSEQKAFSDPQINEEFLSSKASNLYEIPDDCDTEEILHSKQLSNYSSFPEYSAIDLKTGIVPTMSSDFHDENPHFCSEAISFYVNQLIEDQFHDALFAASQFILQRNELAEDVLPENMDRDLELSHHAVEHDSVYCREHPNVIFDNQERVDATQSDQEQNPKTETCFGEIVDDNQNFEIAIFREPFSSSSQVHISQCPDSVTSETANLNDSGETPILSFTSLISHDTTDYTLTPEQRGILTAPKFLMHKTLDYESNDDGFKSSNNILSITGTCQQLQIERMRPTQTTTNLDADDSIHSDIDMIPEDSDCSLYVEMGDLVPTNSSQKLPLETSSPESSLKSLEQPTTSSVLEEVSHFLTTACVAALVYMSPSESSNPSFNSDIIEDASKYISSKSELNQDNQS